MSDNNQQDYSNKNIKKTIVVKITNKNIGYRQISSFGPTYYSCGHHKLYTSREGPYLNYVTCHRDKLFTFKIR